eukprot:166348-Rhodomonas_salina.3
MVPGTVARHFEGEWDAAFERECICRYLCVVGNSEGRKETHAGKDWKPEEALTSLSGCDGSSAEGCKSSMRTSHRNVLERRAP